MFFLSLNQSEPERKNSCSFKNVPTNYFDNKKYLEFMKPYRQQIQIYVLTLKCAASKFQKCQNFTYDTVALMCDA